MAGSGSVSLLIGGELVASIPSKQVFQAAMESANNSIVAPSNTLCNVALDTRTFASLVPSVQYTVVLARVSFNEDATWSAVSVIVLEMGRELQWFTPTMAGHCLVGAKFGVVWCATSSLVRGMPSVPPHLLNPFTRCSVQPT
jgi:hypothetical protein